MRTLIRINEIENEVRNINSEIRDIEERNEDIRNILNHQQRFEKLLKERDDEIENLEQQKEKLLKEKSYLIGKDD